GRLGVLLVVAGRGDGHGLRDARGPALDVEHSLRLVVAGVRERCRPRFARVVWRIQFGGPGVRGKDQRRDTHQQRSEHEGENLSTSTHLPTSWRKLTATAKPYIRRKGSSAACE